MKKVFILLIMIFSVIHLISSTEMNSSFALGNEYYEKGEYEEALKIYLNLADKAGNWKIFYNIGNSYFKLGEIVRSKINYLKADRLKPFDKAIKNNLQIIEELLNNNASLPEPDFISRTLMRIESVLTINILSVSLLVILLVSSFFIFKLIYSGKLKKYIYGILISFILLIFLTFYHIQRVSDLHNNKYAVIIAPDSQLRSGPGEGNTILFEISPGVTIRIIDVNRDWVQVTASPEIAGWIKIKNIEKISIQ